MFFLFVVGEGVFLVGREYGRRGLGRSDSFYFFYSLFRLGRNFGEEVFVFGRISRIYNLFLENFIFVRFKDLEGWNFLVVKISSVNEWVNLDF